MAGKAFDIRLIPEFHGVSSDHTISEWLEQVELVCKMCGVDNVEHVLLLRLRGGALSVYRQLTHDQREDLQQVKQALLIAFAPDPFAAFNTFVSCHLRPGETVDEYLGDLQDLARLTKENTSDWWLSCAFVSGRPSPVRRQLRGSSRIEHMTLEQILARARALMTEEAEVDEPVARWARQRRVLPPVPVGPPSTPDKQNAVAVQCYKCGGPNHFARDCRQLRGKSRRALPTTRTCRIEVSGKRGKGWEASTTLSPHKLEEVLPVMKVKVNGMDQIALVDSGCSSSVVSGMVCRPKVWKSTAILTAGRKCLFSHGVVSITLTVTNRNPLKMNMLVVNSKPLRFDLLLGMDIIKKLGGMHIDEGGKAHFVEAAHTLGATIER